VSAVGPLFGRAMALVDERPYCLLRIAFREGRIFLTLARQAPVGGSLLIPANPQAVLIGEDGTELFRLRLQHPEPMEAKDGGWATIILPLEIAITGASVWT